MHVVQWKLHQTVFPLISFACQALLVFALYHKISPKNQEIRDTYTLSVRGKFVKWYLQNLPSTNTVHTIGITNDFKWVTIVSKEMNCEFVGCPSGKQGWTKQSNKCISNVAFRFAWKTYSSFWTPPINNLHRKWKYLSKAFHFIFAHHNETTWMPNGAAKMV